MDFQTILAFALLGLVIVYMSYRYIYRPLKRSTSPKHDCGPDCNCS